MPGVTIRLLFCVSCWPQHVDSPSRIPLFSTIFFSPPPAWLTSLLQLPLLPAPSRFPSLRIPSIVCDLYTQGIQGEGFVRYVYISLERFATKRTPWQPNDHNIEMKHPPCLCTSRQVHNIYSDHDRKMIVVVKASEKMWPTGLYPVVMRCTHINRFYIWICVCVYIFCFTLPIAHQESSRTMTCSLTHQTFCTPLGGRK